MKTENFTPDKWTNDGCGVYYPIPGETKLHQTPGRGIFELYQSSGPDKRIGLKRIGEKFEFPYKIYDLGCDSLIETVKKTWESDIFMKEEKNLGVIFFGIKGGGKSIASRILCNEIGLPIIIINDIKEGMVEFLQSLYFEAVVLIDEAEKIFKKGESDEVLLKIVDGGLNRSRKLYVLTVNKLDVNENLLGRPGRVRYVKQFGNLTVKAVNDYIDDNLIDKSKKPDILELVDLLEISTIDILKNIVEEFNIHGSVDENSYLNIPKARYVFDIIRFRVSDKKEIEIEEIKNLFSGITNVESWLKEERPGKDSNGDIQTNEDWIFNKYNGYVYKMTTQFQSLWRGCSTNIGEIVESVDDNGFFFLKGIYDEDEYFCKIIHQRNNPSLYRGGLII